MDSKREVRLPVAAIGAMLVLMLGVVWAVVAVIKFVGFLVGLLVIVAIVGGLAAAAYFGYKVAKKHGVI